MIERYNSNKEVREKCTPNQKAKEIVLEVLENAYYWDEHNQDEHSNMTEREQEELLKMIGKQIKRIEKLLQPEFYK